MDPKTEILRELIKESLRNWFKKEIKSLSKK